MGMEWSGVESVQCEEPVMNELFSVKSLVYM